MGDTISSLSLVELRGVLTEVVRQAHEDLVALADALPPLEDGDRKRLLLQQLHAARQRLQRLGVVVGWSAKARAVAECRRVLEAVAAHQGALQDAADQLAYLHGELSWTNPPAYDVATAAHVTAQGTYDLLPTCIEEECGVVAQRAGSRGEAGDASGALDRIARGLARLEFCLRSLLLREPPPSGARVASVRAGVATVEHAEGLYRLRLTLVPAPSIQVTLAQYGGEGAATEVSKEDGAVPAPAASTDWRWRVLGVSLLPSGEALSSPGASTLLPLPAPVLEWMRRSVEQQLWAAADVAALQAQGVLSLVDLPPGSAAGRASTSDLDRGSALSAGGLSALLSGSTGEGGAAAPGADGAGETTMVTSADGGSGTASDAAASSTEPPVWRTRPLALAHRLLSRAAARAAMGALIVPSLRELAATAPFEGHFRIERASATGAPAIRVQLWTSYPAWTAAELASLEAVQRESSADPGAQPNSNHGLADGGAPNAPLKIAVTTQPSPLQLEIRLASPEEDSVDLKIHPSLPLALGGWSTLQPRLPVAAADAAPVLVAVTDAAAALSLLSVQRELRAWAKWARCRLGQAATAWADAGPAAPRRPLSLRLPRRARPRLEVWAAAEPAGRHSTREDRPDAVLAVDMVTGRICLDAEQGAAGALAQGSSVRAALESALHVAEKEAAVGPLEPHHTSRLHLRAELVARAVARRLQARAARRRLEAVHEAVTGLIGEESRADGALDLAGTTARWVPARLLATMAALDGAASGADSALASAPLAVGALSIDLPCFSMRPFGRSSTMSTASPSQSTAQSTGAVGVSLLVRSAPESESVSVDLLVQAATPSGVRLRTLHSLRLTDDFCVGGADGFGSPTRRPHKGKRARDEVHEEDCQPGSSASMIDVGSETLANGDCDSRPGRAEQRPASLPALLSIARRARVWHQLLAQLSVVGLRAGSEEWRLGPGAEVRRVAVVAAPPGLARLDAWHRSRGDLDARALEKTEALPGQAHVEFAVDEEGRWEGSVPSAYFGALDAPANGLCRAVRGRGLVLSGSFARGESLVPAVSGALAAVRLHLCLCRIRRLCAAREGRATDRAPVPDAVLKEVPNHAGFKDCRWRVPGSAASCRVRHADLATARFEVCRPTRAGTNTPPASDDETVVMAVSVSWLPGEEACAPSGPDKGAPAPHEPARWHATARAWPLSQMPSSSKGCRIVAEPAPPEDLCRGLKAALESGREAAFLDALCVSCPLGLDARRALLEPGRQRAAGLLPGALTRLERGLSANAVLSVQIVHGLRALQLSVTGVAGGLTRLTLRRASDAGRAAAPPAEQASVNGHQDAQQVDPARASASGGWFADLIEHCRSVGGEEHAFPKGNGVDPGSEGSDILASAPGASLVLHRKLAALRSAAAASPRQAVVWVRESDVAAATMLVMQAVASGDADAPSQRVKPSPLAASE